MESTANAPRIYRFGFAFKTFLLVASASLIVAGISGVGYAYSNFHGVPAQFAGILVGMLPIALALFGAPALWSCELKLHEDRLEYHGVMVDAVVRKADVLEAHRAPRAYGLESVFLTVAGRPFRKLHIALLGQRDHGAMASWIAGLPSTRVVKL